MNRLCRQLVCNVLVAWALTGCSTPGNRAQEHPAALHRLSPADQQFVLHGHIHPGMSQAAVYIAWGDPDTKTSGGGGKSASETWVYRQRVTIYEPINSYAYYGPFHGFGGGEPGRGFLPAYTYGGVGYEGTLRYQPHVRSLDAVRIAEFSGGKLDRYKGADGTWFGSGRPVVATVNAEPTDRQWPHVARHLAESTRAHHETRVGIHHGRNVAALRGFIAHHRQLHHGGNTGLREKGGVRTVSAHGSKAGAQRHDVSGSHSGHSAHHLGHTHTNAPGQPAPRSA